MKPTPEPDPFVLRTLSLINDEWQALVEIRPLGWRQRVAQDTNGGAADKLSVLDVHPVTDLCRWERDFLTYLDRFYHLRLVVDRALEIGSIVDYWVQPYVLSVAAIDNAGLHGECGLSWLG